MAKYDYLVAGAGIFGATLAQRLSEAGKKVLVVERRKHLAGSCHCDEMEGVKVFRYGPHIFHTKNREVWDYVNRFARFNHYIHKTLTACREGIFETPFNMSTFTHLWPGVLTPEDAQMKIESQTGWEAVGEPKNLEEVCLKEFGRDLYEKLLQGYLEKLWRKPCRELPPSTIRVYPLRYTFDSRRFTDPYQGVPIEGYDVMVKRMLAGCEVLMDTDYLPFRSVNRFIADKVFFTGMIDEFFYYKQGMLDYRTVKYEHEVRDIPNYQGAAVINHPDPVLPYTRTIEHKHFWYGTQPKTVISTETPVAWSTSTEPCYPINDEKNRKILNAYRVLAVAQPDVTFCGRLGSYRWYDLDEAVKAALDLANRELK